MDKLPASKTLNLCEWEHNILTAWSPQFWNIQTHYFLHTVLLIGSHLRTDEVKLTFLSAVDYGLMHLSISSLTASAWQNVFILLIKIRPKGWFLILIQKKNVSRMLLTLNVHDFSVYGSHIVSINKAVKLFQFFRSSIESRCAFHISCHIKSVSTSFDHA